MDFSEYTIRYELMGNLQTALDYYQKAALTTLDRLKLEKYKENIARCRSKLEIMKPSDSFIN